MFAVNWPSVALNLALDNPKWIADAMVVMRITLITVVAMLLLTIIIAMGLMMRVTFSVSDV